MNTESRRGPVRTTSAGTGRRWDVIHFNWGLHDLKFVDGEGRLTDAGKGRHFTPVDQYKQNLDKLVSRLTTTGAKVIMSQPGITINDPYAWVLPRLKGIQLPQNVHVSKEGSRRLEDQVARAILERLSE